jgi:signal transduction histidine kinase
MAEVFIHDLRRSNSEKGIWLSGIFRDKVLNVSDMQLCKQSWGVIGLPIKDHWGRVIGGIIGTTPASPIPQDSSSDLVQFRVFDEDDTKAAKGIASLLGMRFHRELVEEARALSHSMRSHELVAPIHAIKGYCDNLEYSYKNEIKANLDNDVITGIAFDKHLERLSELCDLLELIAVSGGSEDPRESRLVNFEKEILLPVIQPLRPYARKEKATSIEYSDDFQSLPKLYLAFDHMKRALFNVVMNAIKYSKMGQNAKIQILLNDDEDNYLIRIINQGIGIPEGEEDIIFQLFEKGSNADIIYESGSGLGLYITRKILKWHHGDIKLTDRHPENTTFTFIIPKRLELS